MQGILLGVVDRIKSLLPDFRIDYVLDGWNVFTTKARYSMGFMRRHIGNDEVHVATLTIAQSKDGFDVIAANDKTTQKFPLTVANSGRAEKDCWVFDWRFDEAAAEIAGVLKGWA